jgi:hypothetical protein
MIETSTSLLPPMHACDASDVQKSRCCARRCTFLDREEGQHPVPVIARVPREAHEAGWSTISADPAFFPNPDHSSAHSAVCISDGPNYLRTV